uniref:Uncharacterized protein n=1 Tax=Arundo donax TaxID=35708 RepID=A0A0A8YD52_ARUDO
MSDPWCSDWSYGTTGSGGGTCPFPRSAGCARSSSQCCPTASGGAPAASPGVPEQRSSPA